MFEVARQTVVVETHCPACAIIARHFDMQVVALNWRLCPGHVRRLLEMAFTNPEVDREVLAFWNRQIKTGGIDNG